MKEVLDIRITYLENLSIFTDQVFLTCEETIYKSSVVFKEEKKE